MIKVIGFDLDNTLYDHRYYIEGAYKDISKFVSNKYGIEINKYYKWILNRWIQKGSSYNRIFKESYDYFKLDNFQEDIKRILEIYHQSTPKLFPYEGTLEVLENLSKNYKLVIITDGRERTQNYKINRLKLKRFFSKVYISGMFGKGYYKPSTKMFELCLKEEQINCEQMIYIGDNPILDFQPCKELGIRFFRIVKGEYSHLNSENTYNISDIRELPNILKNWRG